MLLQAALAAMILSTGIVVVELRRIDDRYVRNQDQIHHRLNATADQLENLARSQQDLRAINKLLHDDANNLQSTVENYGKELDLYKNKGKEEE